MSQQLQQQVSFGPQSSSNQITKDNYKPFQSEKDLIQSISNQENEIETAVKIFIDTIPRNLKYYKEYGDKLMYNGERMRLQLNIPGQDCKDLFQLILQLSQFFEIIGRLYSQNFTDVQNQISEQVQEVVSVINEAKESNYVAQSLKILPKAQQSHLQIEKLKGDYENATKYAQECIQKLKQVKQNPDLIYNLSEQQKYEERAQRAVADMEDKKQKYKNILQDLNQKHTQFNSILEQLTKQHGQVVDSAAQTVRKMVEITVNTELIHYDSLNLLAPDKAKVIKNFQIKQELKVDIKAAEDQSYKIDLRFAKQKLSDLAEGAITHQSMSPYCQYVSDTSDFYTKVTEKWSKYLQALLQFFQDMSLIEKNMTKQFKELNLSDRKRKEMQFGGFQSTVYELLRTIEIKEKNHINFQRYLDTLVGKLEQILKNYKSDEKTFSQGIQKISKDLIMTNEKTGKQTLQFEKQLVKISQQLSQNFSNSSDDKQNSQFQSLMVEYQQLTEVLKDTYQHFKAMLVLSIDQQYELVKTFKDSQITHLRQVYGVICGLTSFAETFLTSQQQLNMDFLQFVKIMDTDNIYEQFKCQIMNKHQIEFVQQQQQQEEMDSIIDINIPSSGDDQADIIVKEGRTYSQDNTNMLAISQNPSLQQSLDKQKLDSMMGSIANSQNNTLQKVNKSKSVTPERKLSGGSLGSNLSNKDVDYSAFKSPIDHKNLADQERREREEIEEEFSNIKINNQQMFQSELILGDSNSKSSSKLTNQRTNSAYKNSSKSFQVQLGGKRSNGISPMKRSLDQQYAIKEDLEIDDDIRKEMERLTNQNNQQQNQQYQEDPQSSSAPGSKFLFEKFTKLDPGEVFLESFACAVQLKILLQGRIYITNKRMCFHSYFNDKTLFGKETKIQIYFANIQKFGKKTNAKVFDNSIAVLTKEDKEIFFTSFVYRDTAIELMQKQLNIQNGVSSADASRHGSIEDKPLGNDSQADQSQGKGGNKQDEDIDDSNDEEEKEQANSSLMMQSSQNQDQKATKEMQQIYDNAKFTVTDDFSRVENERLEQIKKQFTDFDKFNLVLIDENIDCSLKHTAIVFLNFDQKFPHLDNLSLMEWLEKYPLTNTDLNISCKKLDFPDYFTNSEVPAPEPNEFRNWPLNTQVKIDLLHLTEKPKFMQPKQNKCNVSIDNFIISPRMIIRKALIQNEGFPYADSFTIEYKLTMTQIDSHTSNPKTNLKSEFRVNIIKPIRFLQSTVIKETESSLKDCYGQGPYKDNLLKKIIELKDHMKTRWQQQVQSNPIKSQKVIKKKKKSNNLVAVQQQDQQQSESFQKAEQSEGIKDGNNYQIASNNYGSNINHQSSSNNAELHKDIVELKTNLKQLQYVVYGLFALNMLMMIILILK